MGQGESILTTGRFAEQRAKDAIAFDPLPEHPWMDLLPEGIAISTSYSEPLSRLLRSLPGNKWQPEHRRWLLPYSSAENLRIAIPQISRLVAVAKDSADRESERREEQRTLAAEAKKKEIDAAGPQTKECRLRLLMREYLVPLTGTLRNLSVEAIGDDTDRAMRMLDRTWKPRHACAQVMGRDHRGKWIRVYLRGARDYACANSVGSRGIMINYQIEEGPIYWVAAPQTWRHTDRYFLRVIGGIFSRMTDDEVRSCLEK